MKINKAFIYLITAAIIWGATVPIMKITLREIPIASLVFIRMTVASIVLLPFVYKNLKVKKEDAKIFVLSALFGTNLNLAFLFIGLKYSYAINASVIVSITPLLTLLFAHIFLKEKYTTKLVLGALIALSGVILIVGTPILKTDIMSSIGNLFLVAAAFAWVGHELFSKRLLKSYTPLVCAFYTTFLGGLFFSPLFVLDIVKNPDWISNVSKSGVLGLLYGTFAASIIGYVAWQKGLAKTTASEASFVFYLLPLSGILFSIILLDEKFSPFLLIGATLILIGVIFAELHRKKTKFSSIHGKVVQFLVKLLLGQRYI
mgnify:CR=1 FL=1